jgi:putative sugar O-methyltransferase
MTATIRRRPFSRAAETLVGRMLFRRVPLQGTLVTRMRQEAAALGDVAVEATDLWDGLRTELRQRLHHGDPASFLRWPPVQRTMVMRSHRRAAPELAHLRARSDWRVRWRPAIRETTLGHPHPFTRYPWSSANLIYHAYHLCRFEEATGRSLASMRTIIEFGGGYGRLCQLVHDLGFSGTYVIFDLPEVAILQRFYLGHVGLSVSEGRGGALPERGVVTVVELADLQGCLGSRPHGDAAFVAIGSLSEAPIALRDTLFTDVAALDAFLFFYAAQHDGVDNHAYFTRWRMALAEHDWYAFELPHLYKAASHLFGRRRA